MHEEEPYVARASEARAARMAKGAGARSPLDTFPTREIRSLRGLALEQSNRETAASYRIGTKTIDICRARLLRKRNIRDNAELARFARPGRDRGMVAPPAPHRKKKSDVRIKIGPMFRFPPLPVSFRWGNM
jgi:hypothetical protein